MFTINKDYIIKNTDTPVLTNHGDGHFEFQDCYLLEFFIKNDTESLNKIQTLCMPFDFNTGVQNVISKHSSNTVIQRLFLLSGPDIIENKFKNPDDFLVLALCIDNKQKTKIQYFEVNYKFRHSYEPNQKYRHIGTSAVKALQKIYQNRELYGESALHALKFWFKNGFTRINEHPQYIHWYQR